jgi:hypothetical protein
MKFINLLRCPFLHVIYASLSWIRIWNFKVLLASTSLSIYLCKFLHLLISYLPTFRTWYRYYFPINIMYAIYIYIRNIRTYIRKKYINKYLADIISINDIIRWPKLLGPTLWGPAAGIIGADLVRCYGFKGLIEWYFGNYFLLIWLTDWLNITDWME